MQEARILLLAVVCLVVGPAAARARYNGERVTCGAFLCVPHKTPQQAEEAASCSRLHLSLFLSRSLVPPVGFHFLLDEQRQEYNTRLGSTCLLERRDPLRLLMLLKQRLRCPLWLVFCLPLTARPLVFWTPKKMKNAENRRECRVVSI